MGVKKLNDKNEVGEINSKLWTEKDVHAGVANYWEEMKACSKKTSIYYAPTLSVSLFPEGLKGFNPNNMDKRYSFFHKVERTKFLDIYREKNSTFGMHAEDMNFFSLSSNHTGAPKIWYVVERRFQDEIVKLANNSIKNNVCDHLLIHGSR